MPGTCPLWVLVEPGTGSQRPSAPFPGPLLCTGSVHGWGACGHEWCQPSLSSVSLGARQGPREPCTGHGVRAGVGQEGQIGRLSSLPSRGLTPPGGAAIRLSHGWRGLHHSCSVHPTSHLKGETVLGDGSPPSAAHSALGEKGAAQCRRVTAGSSHPSSCLHPVALAPLTRAQLCPPAAPPGGRPTRGAARPLPWWLQVPHSGLKPCLSPGGRRAVSGASETSLSIPECSRVLLSAGQAWRR